MLAETDVGLLTSFQSSLYSCEDQTQAFCVYHV